MRILEALTRHHNPGLVLLAAAICAFGALATMTVAGRATSPGRQGIWIALLSLCAAATIWSTHFIAMLAYRAGDPLTYDPDRTAASFLVGVVVMYVGFHLGVRRVDQRWARLSGGAVLGLGVVLLHFVGMASLRFPGTMGHDPDLVALAVGCSIAFGAATVALGLEPGRAHARTLGAALMVVMTVTLHFTAMGGVHLELGHGTHGPAGVSRSVLAAATAVAAFSVLVIGIVGAVLDQRISFRLAAEADRFRTLADGAFEGLILHRDGVIVDANAAARQLLRLPAAESGREIGDWFAIARPLGAESASTGTATEAMEGILCRTDGTEFPAEICRRPIRLPDGTPGELCAIRDVTARKESEARIAHLALHDSLTELPNRRFFLELAQKSVALAQRNGEGLAVMALDVDDFKLVNDMHGHQAGDELIRAVADRITGVLRESDVGARFGGDEFAILQSGANQPGRAMALAERLIDALSKPIALDAAEVTVSVSIGIALFPDDGSTPDQLMRSADIAMYRAKADGKATCRFFEPQMDAALIARRRLEHGLRRALAEDHFFLVYQPIVDSRTRRPLGFEALVRWNDPEVGPVMPGDFIPVAEETGLIVPIGLYVLRQACMDALHWPDDLRVAVNLSAVQFRRRGLVDAVREILAESGLPGDRLELEVTESVLLENRHEALIVLTQLKELGVHIAMDDFGTGYSSLSYLQSFPFDKIKIDRMFLSGLPQHPQNASIVRAVASLGRSLDMRVVAEGVETDCQADTLMGLDCDELQGFLIARPMPAGDIGSFLEAAAEPAFMTAEASLA